MALPEINRAGIKKLESEVDVLQTDVATLKGDIEGIDPVISDHSFPNIIPSAPVGVVANALFRTIQVMWQNDASSYIASYQVFASQEAGFTPLDKHLIWEGRNSAYQHKASTDETWYFRVRAKNYHDEVSAFSAEVSATTVDISEFEINEQYKTDLIEYTNQYTDDAKNALMNEMAHKMDATFAYDNLLLSDRVFVRSDVAPDHTKHDFWFDTVNQKFMLWNGASWVDASYQQIQERSIDTTDTGVVLKSSTTDMHVRMGDVIGRVDTVEGELTVMDEAIRARVTKDTYDALEGRVTSAEGLLAVAPGEVILKASDTYLSDTEQRLSTAEGSITTMAGEIEARVSKDGVIASINLSPEELQIDVANVAITGDLEVLNGQVRLKEAIIDNVHIKDKAIVGRMFADNAIVGEINAGTALIDFAKIGNVQITNAMIEELDGNKITANSINVEHLAIGNMSNMTPDARFEKGLEHYNLTGKITIYTDSSRAHAGSNGAVCYGANSYIVSKKRYDLSPGERITLTWWSHATGNYYGKTRAVCMLHMADGTYKWQTGTIETIKRGLTKHVYSFTAPDGVVSIDIGVGGIEALDDLSGVIISDFHAYREVQGELIAGTIRGVDIYGSNFISEDSQYRMDFNASRLKGRSTVAIGGSVQYDMELYPAQLYIGDTTNDAKATVSPYELTVGRGSNYTMIEPGSISGNGNLLISRTNGNVDFDVPWVGNSGTIAGTLRHSGGYFQMFPYTGSMDDGSWVRSYYNGTIRQWYLYVQNGGSKGSLLNIQAGSFSEVSLETFKTNIVKMDSGALDIIRKADIYEYDLKEDSNGRRKRYGFVIGEGYNTPDEVLSDTGDAISGYNHRSINTLAIKELLARVEELERKLYA